MSKRVLLFTFLTQQVAEHQGRRTQPSDQEAKMLNSTAAVANNTQVRGVLGLTFIWWAFTYATTPPQGSESAEQLNDALQGNLMKDTAMVAWGFDPDRQLDDPTLENMLLRIEEMQVSASCTVLILTTQSARKKSTVIDLVFIANFAVV